MSTVELEATAVTTNSGARLLAAPTPDRATHEAVHGRLPEVDPARLLEEVRRSGLTGRGGAGFPTAVKLAAVRSQPGPKIVVANGAEGEPASVKDRELLLTAPHLMMDGVQLAARIVGADEAVVHVRADAADAVRRALSERRDRVPVRVVVAADGFLSGQETAVVNRLNGGPPVPVFSRRRVIEHGVGGRPTLVQNVETLAQLALIARHGAAWFGSVGVDGAPGTFLATVHPMEGGSPRVWEVPHGLPLGDLLVAAGVIDGRDGEPGHDGDAVRRAGSAGTGVREYGGGVQAVLIGGYHGAWVPGSALGVPLTAAGLKPLGGGLGAGVVIPLGHDRCGLQTTARIVDYLAGQSARQCGPCLFGLPHLAQRMTALAHGSAGGPGLRAVQEAAGLVTGRGACHHPDGTARLVRSALLTFERDAVLHAHGRCLAHLDQPYGDQPYGDQPYAGDRPYRGDHR